MTLRGALEAGALTVVGLWLLVVAGFSGAVLLGARAIERDLKKLSPAARRGINSRGES